MTAVPYTDRLDVVEERPLLTFLGWQIIGLVLLASHVYLAVAFGQVALPLVLFVSIVALAYAFDAFAGLMVLLQFLLYQNVVISTISSALNVELYHTLQATSFAALLAVALVAAQRLWLSGGTRSRNLLLSLLAAATVMALYALLGATRSSPTSAAIYARSATTGLVGLVIGLDVGRRIGFKRTAAAFLFSLALGLVLTTLEITMPAAYYELIDAKDYEALKFLSVGAATSFYSPDDVVSQLTTGLFNLSDTGLSFRFEGPNMHSISYAYILSIGALSATCLGWTWMLAVLVPLLLLIGVKGAAILFIVTMLLWAVGRWHGGRALIALALIYGAAYVGLILWYGLSVGDYHVIGFLGGWDGFLRQPFGHGLGVGGNLAAGAENPLDWDMLQHYGASFGMESAIGVLLYQMGIGIAACGFVIWCAARPIAGRLQRTDGLPVGLLAIALYVLTLNAMFQEEAFAPYALGLLMLLSGAAAGTPSSASDR